MAKLYRLYFQKLETEYHPDRKYAKKKTKSGPDLKLFVGADGGATVLESEIKHYWDFGDGVVRCELAGEMDDNYFKPTLSEADFVENQIKSKKNGEVVGYQG